LEAVNAYDEKWDEADTSNETFKAGVKHEVDITEDHGESVDMQFGDGSMIYNVPKAIFKVVK